MLQATRPLEYGLRMPVDSSRTIREVGEFINQLWGAPTPGGHIFPSPMARRGMAIGWSPDSREVGAFWPESFSEQRERSDWSFIVVLAVDTDEAILEFQADFEVTNLPASLVRGRDDWAGTSAWLADHPIEMDEVDVLDRLFVVNIGPTPRPRNVGQFAGLPRADRVGRWILVRSDFPSDAAAHARVVWNGTSDHQVLGDCDQCWVHGVASGTWSQVLKKAGEVAADLRPLAPMNIGTPHLREWSV
jgi:hypothetical protein